MSKFPARLWHSKPGGNSVFDFWEKPEWTNDVPEPVEYISKQEHTAILAALQAENERLRKALEKIDEHTAEYSGVSGNQQLYAIVKEALKPQGEK